MSLGHLSDEIVSPSMGAGIQGPVVMEMEGAWDPSGRSIQASMDWFGMHLSPIPFPLLSSSFDSIVVSTSIAMGHLSRGGHMGSHGGGRGMICCNIPLGLPSTPPSIVIDLSTCLGESKDSKIRYNLRNHIVLIDHQEKEDFGMGLASCTASYSRGRGRKSFMSIS